ncbi:reverse transcriptase domain-containing protein [Streptomyces sp. NPDC086519]|uniref:reverse transcriptase domain-containing protein n=1 Tax=Streptomyces sp. NPDC086519 TaxID=3154863 RepID=UPI003437DF56
MQRRMTAAVEGSVVGSMRASWSSMCPNVRRSSPGGMEGIGVFFRAGSVDGGVVDDRDDAVQEVLVAFATVVDLVDLVDQAGCGCRVHEAVRAGQVVAFLAVRVGAADDQAGGLEDRRDFGQRFEGVRPLLEQGVDAVPGLGRVDGGVCLPYPGTVADLEAAVGVGQTQLDPGLGVGAAVLDADFGVSVAPEHAGLPVGGVAGQLLDDVGGEAGDDMEREFPTIWFEYYADDAVLHCVTERQAREVLAALRDRTVEVGLQMHPDKTRIVYRKDDHRRSSFEHTAFTFLGYTFRARKNRLERRRPVPTSRLPTLVRLGRAKRSSRPVARA